MDYVRAGKHCFTPSWNPVALTQEHPFQCSLHSFFTWWSFPYFCLQDRGVWHLTHPLSGPAHQGQQWKKCMLLIPTIVLRPFPLNALQLALLSLSSPLTRASEFLHSGQPNWLKSQFAFLIQFFTKFSHQILEKFSPHVQVISKDFGYIWHTSLCPNIYMGNKSYFQKKMVLEFFHILFLFI